MMFADSSHVNINAALKLLAMFARASALTVQHVGHSTCIPLVSSRLASLILLKMPSRCGQYLIILV